MDVVVDCPFEFAVEIAREPAGNAPAFHRERIDADLGDLLEEAFVGGVLAGRLPCEADAVRARVAPVWSAEPIVSELQVELRTLRDGAESGSFLHCQRDGRWTRRCRQRVDRLRDEGALGSEERAWMRVVATRAPARTATGESPWPLLEDLPVVDRTLGDLGVRALGEGGLAPERPVLVSERMLEEIVVATERAGASETGGAALGTIARLPEPLPGTTTALVTVLTACVADPRHAGSPGRFTFSPEGLAEAARIADVRGRGESVLTVFHTHGWGTDCGRCNESETCAIPTCASVSDDDYVVAESLFPSKATLLPIAGRKLGAPGRRPVLEVHAWRSGLLRPIPWSTFRE